MEFKRLSDVEVVAEPAESANVLIEENGVIKKAPKTAVGGAGGDYDLEILCEMTDDFSNITTDNFSLVSGSFTEVFTKARYEGKIIRAKIIMQYYIDEEVEVPFPYYYLEIIPAVNVQYEPGIFLSWVISPPMRSAYQQSIGITESGFVDFNSAQLQTA